MSFPTKANGTLIGVSIGGNAGTTGQGAATANVTALAAFLKWAPEFVTDYKYPVAGIDKTYIRYQQWAGYPHFINWNQQMIGVGWSAADVLAGKHDSLWVTDAQNMVKYGRANDPISIGYEGNDSWGPGSAPLVGDATYSKLWSYVHDLYRANGWAGPAIWNYAVQSAKANGLSPDAAFPASGVDAIGWDPYERGGYAPWGTVPSASHAGYWVAEGQPKWLAQAAFHPELPHVASESAIMLGQQNSGGDDPYYLQRVAQELKDRQWAAYGYFNAKDGVQNSQLFTFDGKAYSASPLFPKTAPVFPALFKPSNFTGYPPSGEAELEAQLTAALTQLASTQAEVATLEDENQSLTFNYASLQGKVTDLTKAWAALQ